MCVPPPNKNRASKKRWRERLVREMVNTPGLGVHALEKNPVWVMAERGWVRLTIEQAD